MSKTTWRDAERGDVVELGGREWTVAKVKRGGKKAKVTVAHKGREASSTVKLADRVRIVKRAADVDPVQDRFGSQRRWATEAELTRELTRGLPAGDSSKRKPPEKAKGGSWEKPKGDAEKAVTKILGARLIGESKNEAAGYYVPPVDVSTVAAHLAVFHGGIPETVLEDYAGMMRAHAAQHDEAKKTGVPLAVNHWHTEIRP